MAFRIPRARLARHRLRRLAWTTVVRKALIVAASGARVPWPFTIANATNRRATGHRFGVARRLHPHSPNGRARARPCAETVSRGFGSRL